MRKRLLGGLAVMLWICVATTPAWASSDHYFSSTLPHQAAFASAGAHSNVYYSQAVTNHTICVGYGTGWGGWYTDHGTMDFYICAQPGPSSVVFYDSDPVGTYHGAIANPNVSTDDAVSDSHYSWTP